MFIQSLIILLTGEVSLVLWRKGGCVGGCGGGGGDEAVCGCIVSLWPCVSGSLKVCGSVGGWW